MKYILSVLFSVLSLLTPAMLFAADVTIPDGAAADLGTQIAVIAALVVTILQGIKQTFPAISGRLAQVLALVLSIAASFAAAPPNQILTLTFFLSSLGSWLAAIGAFKLATAKPTIPPTQ